MFEILHEVVPYVSVHFQLKSLHLNWELQRSLFSF